MLNKLRSTLRGWTGRYGAEAALVGRVALAAFLPPGCNQILIRGLEAAFEYIQGKSETINDHDLANHLESLGVPHAQLDEAVHQIELSGQDALARVHEANRCGISETNIVSQLRELIAHDPTLNALQTSMQDIATQLGRVEAQGELLIAGQQYQTAAIEEMMAMIQAIANQVGLPPESIPTRPSMSIPTSSIPTSSIPTSSLSPSEQLLGLSMTDFQSSNSPTNSLNFGASLLTSSTNQDPSSLDGFNTPLDRIDPQAAIKQRQTREAQDLVARFMQQRKERAQTSHLEQSQAVALVKRFQEQIASRQNNQTVQEFPQVGQGRVALTLTDIGDTPIMIIKWLCEEWKYSLTDAMIVSQSAPCIIRRDDNFIVLGQAKTVLERLGAKIKIQV